jgi:16S rRNA (guanine1207-N2)-methyltransferase
VTTPTADAARPTTPGRFVAQLNDQHISVRSRPGFSDWDVVTPAMQLIAERVSIPAEGQAVFWGAGHGALVAALLLAEPTARATVVQMNLVARDAAEGTLHANGVADRATVVNYPRDLPAPGTADLVVVLPVQSRDLNRRLLLESLAALKQGGRLAIAGPNGGGIRTTIGDATALLGTPRDETSRMKQRLAVYLVDGPRDERPAWADEPGIAPGTWAPLSVTIDGEALALATLPGVFSADGLDAGTAMLLDNLPDLSGKRVLDLGCGAGVIGIAAARAGAADVTMIDVDLMAVAAARENVDRMGVPGTTAVASDLYGSIHDREFDVILSNPPFHAGQRIDHDISETIVRGAPAVMATGGELVLVANRFLAYDRAIRETFGGVARLADNEKYHVLRGIKAVEVEVPDAMPDEMGAADPYAVTDELRRRFPIIDGGAAADDSRPARPFTRRRSTRSIRRGPGRNKK